MLDSVNYTPFDYNVGDEVTVILYDLSEDEEDELDAMFGADIPLDGTESSLEEIEEFYRNFDIKAGYDTDISLDFDDDDNIEDDKLTLVYRSEDVNPVTGEIEVYTRYIPRSPEHNYTLTD
jgi:hypothetical protein